MHIRCAATDEAEWLQAAFAAALGWGKPAGHFAAVLARQARQELALLLALSPTEAYMGHCQILWRSGYAGFAAAGIPEIQDLNVATPARRRGIGSALLAEAERRIAARADYAGIGFGLYADYGAAQRLYIMRGYVPDGAGLQVRGQPVQPGQAYPVDDDMVLYLCKRLTALAH